ncbi:hypothetical protein F5984_11295 [Rudanella paleaurantiibacter]|uniref:Uncharacterized protein n=1 Tax=Rudanella paleaurantiibacter TaxID=2614655 RepID=A0A7J5U1F3_9BACT|nr:hypothetical protein [Rudanella paleaurantiibacter]KAB7731371.1 hypothetical protein F5984_11295 [Rudanella paleaurantiibacter]
MQILLLFLAFLGPLRAHIPDDLQPHLTYRLLVDNKPLDWQAGAPVSLKSLRIEVQLDEESQKLYPHLKGQPIYAGSVISLARGNRRLGMIRCNLTQPLTNFLTQATPGDRLVIEVQDVQIRQKDGTLKPLSDGKSLVYSVPLH